MTWSMDHVFIVAVPLTLALLMAFVLFSSRLPPALRLRMERVLGLLVWPAATVWWIWQAVGHGFEGKWVNMVLMGAVAVTFGVQGVMAIRQGRFIPARKARAT